MTINPRNFRVANAAPWYVQVGGLALAWSAMAFGAWLDRVEQHRMTRFRDKSALYAGANPDPENNPSWGPKGDYPYNYSKWQEN